MASDQGTSISNTKLPNTLVPSGTSEEKTKNVIKCLNVNESFANYCDNAPLQTAVGKEEEKIVIPLLEKGTGITLENNEDKTTLDVPKDLNTDKGQMIQALDKKLKEQYKIIKFIRNVSNEKNIGTNTLSLFKKSKGIISMKGPLYEINLFSLILLRTLLNPKIDQFYLGTSVQEVGALEDICLRYRKNNKESVVFLHPKYTTNEKITVKDLWNSTGNFSLSKYFNSYLNIRHKFESEANNSMFQGRYEDTRCQFIIYTTAKEELLDKKTLNKHLILDTTVVDILSTSDKYYNIFQYKYDDEDIKLLMKNVMVDRMKKIGEKLYESTQGNNYKNMLCDKHISGYHVVLANTVIHVSVTAVDGTRKGWFREEFLSSSNELLIVIKEAFFKEAVKKTNINLENLVKIVQMFLREPSVENISKLLQTVPTSYNLENNRLDILNNNIKELFLSSLYETVISHTTYSKAFQIAVKEKTGSFHFKLPLKFGNVDVNVNESDAEKALNDIAFRIENVISQFGDKDMIITDKDNIHPSLIGNLIVFDEDSSMFKFNTCAESLGQNANNIVNILKNKIEDLDAYRLQFNIDNIPKISFEADENDYCLARDFLNNLWFYTSQAKDHEIESYANYNVSNYYFIEFNKTFCPNQLSDIFSNIQREIKKWWLLDTTQVHYVTNYMQIFDECLKDLASQSILSSLNKPYLNKTQEHEIAFNRQAIQSLSLDTMTDLTVIETENTTLTAIKLYQYFRETNYNYIFIDFNFIPLLPLQDNKILVNTLEKIYRQRIIIIYDHLSTDIVNINDLLNPSLAKTIILVINENHLEEIMKQAPVTEYNKVRDEKNNLRDLLLFSHEQILQKTLLFQGMESSFETLIDTESQHLISANILSTISNNETIEIGECLSTPNYEQIKYCYMQRSLYRSIINKTYNENVSSTSSSSKVECNASSQVQEEIIELKTLEYIKDTVVLIAEPGMGKSTLLTHLSIETKKNNPRIWIERVNLLNHVPDFCKWQNNKLRIDQFEALRFLCKTVISKHLTAQNVKYDNEKINFNIEVTNGILSLKNCNELDYLIRFELEIFIHCYNKGNTILIFDGFDRICPHYKNIVFELLKCLSSKMILKSGDNSEMKQKMWITSRPYGNIKETLEAEFGTSYSLKPFTDAEQNLFIEKYLSINLNLNYLNYQQFQNIDRLFKYMLTFSELHKDINEIMSIKPAIAPLHNLYCALIVYLQREIRKAPITVNKTLFNEKWNLYVHCLKASELLADWNQVSDEAMYLIRTPLHVYVAANYFENEIKVSKNFFLSNQWDLDANTFAFYENYLKVNLKKIRFEERNHVDLHNLRTSYENEHVEFVTKHKQLAFYYIFKNEANNYLDSREIDEIQQTIGRVGNSEEKSVLKGNLVFDVPKFVYLTFVEYLAVEYITDLLQTDSYEKQIKTWEFILDVVLPRCSFRILEILERKVIFNSKLKDVISNLVLKGFIDHSLLNKSPYSLDIQKLIIKFLTNSSPYVIYVKSPLDIAVYCGMTNFAVLLLTAITDKVTEDNLDEFIDFIKEQYFLILSVKYGYNEILELVLNCVRRVDSKKLHKIAMIVYRPEQKLPGVDSSNEDIIDYLKATFDFTVQLKVRRQLRPMKLIKKHTNYMPDGVN